LHRAFEDAPIAPDTAQWLPADQRRGRIGILRRHEGSQLHRATTRRAAAHNWLLILADYAPRPGFSGADRQALQTLVDAFTASMELLALASHAREGALRLLETVRRFREIANSAPVLINSTEDRTAPRPSSTTGGWNSRAGACRKRWEMAGATVSIPNAGPLCAMPSRGPLRAYSFHLRIPLAAKGRRIPLDARPRGAAVSGECNIHGLRGMPH
jgi:hypothetical protein